jgi:hypothetical protein
MKVIADGDPRYVLDPRDEPVGCTNPVGKGLLRVALFVKYELVVAISPHPHSPQRPGEMYSGNAVMSQETIGATSDETDSGCGVNGYGASGLPGMGDGGDH